MPRFYFDVRCNDGLHRDDVGDEFADVEEAREQCRALLPDIVQGELPEGDLHVVTCEVRDGTGRVVYRGKLIYEGACDPT